MHNVKTAHLIIAVLVLTLLLVVMSYFRASSQMSSSQIQRATGVQSYEQCVQAGYPLNNAIPPQCVTPDGHLFNAPQYENSSATVPLQQNPAGRTSTRAGRGCVVAGCSNQLCIEASMARDVLTTCEYRAEYGCYKEARCERQRNNQCGWARTMQLEQCLQNPPPLQGGVQVY